MADTISGVTRNSAGTPVPGATVEVYDTASNAFLGTAVSNGAGAYVVTLSAPSSACFAVGYLHGTPDIAGTTLDNLVSIPGGSPGTLDFSDPADSSFLPGLG